MFYKIMDILGFYLVIIGTWRLANATAPAPIGTKMFQYAEEEKNYNPLWDILSPHLVVCWMLKTILSFSKPGKYTDAVILHKKFNWGLLWVLLGVIIHFVCGLVK